MEDTFVFQLIDPDI